MKPLIHYKLIYTQLYIHILQSGNELGDNAATENQLHIDIYYFMIQLQCINIHQPLNHSHITRKNTNNYK